MKGGLLGLLYCFFINTSGLAQDFFYAETDPSSEKYGEVCTTQLTKETADLLDDIQLNQQEWSSFFHIKTAPSNPAVLGKYSMRNNQIVFTPRFLPDPSINYNISFSYKALNEIIRSSLKNETFVETVKFSAINSQPLKIISITPDLSKFPKNILRLYVHFSSPMSFQNPFDFVSIKDDKGNLLIEPFVVLPEGLWNADRTRLTLLFHPGRIKRGVGPNMTEGDILEEGKKYTLEISRQWAGANDKSLDKAFEKSFTVTAPVSEVIQYSEWKLSMVKENTLLIKTIHALDNSLAKRMLHIKSKEGEILPITTEFIDPYQIKISWSKQSGSEYELLIDPRLEDICGNTPLNPFDYESGNRAVSSEMLIRYFTVEDK